MLLTFWFIDDKLGLSSINQRRDFMQLGVVESRFADLIWSHEPIASGELVKLCAKELEWKKPTTYNVLRKLCEKGIFQNQNGVVSSILSKNAFYAMQGEKLVNDAFDGSLPAFIAAFAKRKSLSQAEVEEIRQLIANYEE